MPGQPCRCTCSEDEKHRREVERKPANSFSACFILASLMVSAYWESTCLKMALTCRSSFNSLPSWKSRPGVSMTDNIILSNLFSDISRDVLWIVWVGLEESPRNFVSAVRCSSVAEGDMSAVSSKSRRSDDFPVPLPPTTYWRLGTLKWCYFKESNLPWYWMLGELSSFCAKYGAHLSPWSSSFRIPSSS